MARKRSVPVAVALWRRFTVGQRWIAGVAAAVVVATVVVLLWPDGKQAEPARERQYLQFTACLLTPEKGVADPAAVAVWAGMREASVSTRAKVQYLAVSGEQTVENALTFLSSLAQGGCNLVFAAGPLAVEAAQKGAATFPAQRFVTAGGVPNANVSTVDAAAPHDGVVRTITEAVAANPR